MLVKPDVLTVTFLGDGHHDEEVARYVPEQRIATLEATLAERDRRVVELEADVDAARQLLADTPAIARAIEAAGVSRLTKLSSRIARLEEALRFYGDSESYERSCAHLPDQPEMAFGVMCDGGKRARQALDKEKSDV